MVYVAMQKEFKQSLQKTLHTRPLVAIALFVFILFCVSLIGYGIILASFNGVSAAAPNDGTMIFRFLLALLSLPFVILNAPGFFFTQRILPTQAMSYLSDWMQWVLYSIVTAVFWSLMVLLITKFVAWRAKNKYAR